MRNMLATRSSNFAIIRVYPITLSKRPADLTVKVQRRAKFQPLKWVESL
jgi:hypothetical protein